LEEIWKNIIDFEDIYQVSNFGRIRSLDKIIYSSDNRNRTLRGRILKNKLDRTKKYQHVYLSHKGIATIVSVHRTVAKHFIPNPENKPEVNHKDGNGLNNRIDNLEWNTRCENIQHSFDIGIRKPYIIPRDKCHLTKLSTSKIRSLIKMYNSGFSYKEMAKEFKMSVSGLEKIISKYKNNEQYMD
jgi:hypothetical protein